MPGHAAKDVYDELRCNDFVGFDDSIGFSGRIVATRLDDDFVGLNPVTVNVETGKKWQSDGKNRSP